MLDENCSIPDCCVDMLVIAVILSSRKGWSAPHAAGRDEFEDEMSAVGKRSVGGY